MSASDTEIVRMQRAKWALLSHAIKAQFVVVAAALTTAIINTAGFGLLAFSPYRPTAWFGGLLALTMAVAFLTEVLLVPAIIAALPRWLSAPVIARRFGAA